MQRTSNLRLSVVLNAARCRSFTTMFVDTLAPASRHTLAATGSKAASLLPCTPETAQTAHATQTRETQPAHQQDSKKLVVETSLEVGTHVKRQAANGPPCERNIALSASDNDGT